jgi:hypothetical protein
MKDLNITLSGESKELVLRTGEAEKIVYPKGINITGILAAPYQFFEGRVNILDPEKCHLEIQKDNGVIEFHILDTDPHSTSKIKGQLTTDGYFRQWGINTEKRWSVSQFLKHVKMQRAFFSEPSECDSIVSSLQQWNAKVETVIKQHNDNAGNSLSMLERKVSEIGLKTTFSLTIPIFQGYENQKFTVEIGLDPKNTQVDLYLFSNDLFSLEIDHREALIERELAKFADFPCSKVVIS